MCIRPENVVVASVPDCDCRVMRVVDMDIFDDVVMRAGPHQVQADTKTVGVPVTRFQRHFLAGDFQTRDIPERAAQTDGYQVFFLLLPQPW